MIASTESNEKQWIRGVNIGGWLVLENYITPYLFALTECHANGDFRFYEGQVDAPPKSSPLYKPMDDAARKECPPLPLYPIDEWSFVKSFKDPETAEALLDIHYENFLTRDDVRKLRASGVTHFRVPVPHWILGNIAEDEPYLEGGWKYFTRLVEWCREEGIQMWPELHTVPGSQNGFDNSGHLGNVTTCDHWDNAGVYAPGGQLPKNVGRTLNILDEITARIRDDGFGDVVTGFGLMNEPMSDCDQGIIRRFYNIGLELVRKNMGKDASVYIGDSFGDDMWNGFWTEPEYKGTFLDSHMYHSFEVHARHLSPRQQIALVCQRDQMGVRGCCYDGNGHVSNGIGRIYAEWSASFDRDVGVQIPFLMESIRYTGLAPEMDRQLKPARQAFLRNFVEAQIVNYEPDISSGWFFWNFKMEGGYTAEWDFLRGQKEGWFPKLLEPDVTAEDVYGSCYEIMLRTDDDRSILEEYPPTPWDLDTIPNPMSDDVVLSTGENIQKNPDGTYGPFKHKENGEWVDNWSPPPPPPPVPEKRIGKNSIIIGSLYATVACVFFFLMCAKRSAGSRSGSGSYTSIVDESSKITDDA